MNVLKSDLFTSWPVAILWVSLSFSTAFASLYSFFQSEWFVREVNTEAITKILQYDREALIYTLGIFIVCHRDSKRHFLCHTVNGSFQDFSSFTWQSICIIYGGGCVLLTLSAGLSMMCVTVLNNFQKKLAAQLVGHIQLIGAITQTASLLFYPAVLGTHFGRLHCGVEADFYSLASCRLGWSYMLAIVGTILSYYCPLLAQFVTYRLSENTLWQI